MKTAREFSTALALSACLLAAPSMPVFAQDMDHSAMQMPQQDAQVDHAAMGQGPAAKTAQPAAAVPTATDADRAAAFPQLSRGHDMHDNALQHYVLIDRLEVWDADHGSGLAWDGRAWLGTDLDRVWLRSEGERSDGATENAGIEVLYGRSISPWWDLVAGIRHDFEPGDAQDFAAVGLVGLAPQKFEIEATAYLGEHGQTALRFEAEYELLLSNRWILQPRIEAELHGRDDLRRSVGTGLGTAEAGIRLRYEVTRQFAPYLGIVHERAFGRTARFQREAGEDARDTRLVAGIRVWF